ncbi:hypothetical protein BDY21DRAFT_294641 [Lineolata rhizophorae]|uniref:non-specific serine/threonine protein kinase n=1 Tax=Lineolata rhizophorae TaxID=578093 RepID=A0A6A6NLW8_9PEZI|nr:hypothetical protein BDY21DRAFT_294641 [Lineolata rhizophorae]
MDEELTQPNTQRVVDPRREGRNNSGLRDIDLADVICILHPTTPAAFRTVQGTAAQAPQHILQNDDYLALGNGDVEEQETFILGNDARDPPLDEPQDLALRFSSKTRRQHMGFCFGRNRDFCDILIGQTPAEQRRVSNVHFRIYVNRNGMLMLQDMSTNGTLVDGNFLKGKGNNKLSQRMLNAGSCIEILNPDPKQTYKFVVRIPSRGAYQAEYEEAFRKYMAEVERAEKEAIDGAPAAEVARVTKPTMVGNSYAIGMHWDGGKVYNPVRQIGKGAFASVYQIARVDDGELMAVKELEKRRFMKNGQLDQKLDTEMRIMQQIKHENIVKFEDVHYEKDYFFIIMEYVPGGDLSTYLQKHSVLDEQMAKCMARQVLEALAYLHSLQITHRDIKPDNILVASYDPFVVKLSDFGLSKVVKNNETFLKTFCGTLLYCAPEVFPWYDNYVNTRGTKRRRGASAKKFHSYSQSVDIWSFGAVLWQSLCTLPPFEGVADHNGMLDQIMTSSLDPSPLRARGISEECIDLLVQMLDTNPAQRPTEKQCLQHPWLAEGEKLAEDDLGPIVEEDEEEAEYQLSQLSLEEEGEELLATEQDPPGDYEPYENRRRSRAHEHPYVRRSKRVKPDVLAPRNQPRGRAETDEDDSSEDYNGRTQQRDFGSADDDSFVLPRGAGEGLIGAPTAGRLFGEIGRSALQSSGLLGQHAKAALDTANGNGDSSAPGAWIGSSVVEPRRPDDSDFGFAHSWAALDSWAAPANGTADGQAGAGALDSAGSLMGAESMVRGLHMASTGSSSAGNNSPPTSPAEPDSPRTPPPPGQKGSQHSSRPRSENSDEPTPRAHRPPLGRQVTAPPATSLYFDTPDRPMPVVEHASRSSTGLFASGFESPGHVTASESASMQAGAAEAGKAAPAPDAAPPSGAGLADSAAFVRPRRLLGRLTTTPDSFRPFTFKLEQQLYIRWGRSPHSHLVHPDPTDTRVSKSAFVIFHHAPGIEQADRAGEDWTKLPGLYTGIVAFARGGVWVNGVHLRAGPGPETQDGGAQPYGRLHTGDVITVFHDVRGAKGECLKFVCEFFHGEAARPRPTGQGFKVMVEGGNSREKA